MSPNCFDPVAIIFDHCLIAHVVQTLAPPPCLMLRRGIFFMQNDLSGLTLFRFLSTKTSNPLPQYSTAPNVRNILIVFGRRTN